jgi:D-arabinan exo alpha-(1,3)/(1,5)-arabinofuranosidase (non-reducing end)
MTVASGRVLAVVAAVVSLGVPAGADLRSSFEGPLASLALPHRGVPKHASSTDPTGGNIDFRGVPSGQTITLIDASGAGVVHRFWLTVLPRIGIGPTTAAQSVAVHRQTILRMYWDGETSPSVEVPLGDFFGVGFGEQRDYVSLPLSETSGGYNCYWPMPFHRAARWTLTNLGPAALLVWWNIDYTAFPRLAPGVPHFHAQWRRENPTTAGKAYTILEATGRGHFAGTALFMQNRHDATFGFLEGDEQIFVDGETTPSIIGTGTEDYFSGGFYFDRGPVSAPYHGANLQDVAGGRVSAYRWHVEDAMPFTRSIRVTIEHGHANSVEGDYSSVAYFYQDEPHAPFPPLPADPAALLPFTLP